MVTTARATAKLARVMVAGASRTTATTVTTMAAMAARMTPNGNKDNEDGICRHQQHRDIICRSKSAGKRSRQLISQDGHRLLNSRRQPPLDRGVLGNAAGGSGSVKAVAVSIAGGCAASARGGGFAGATNLWRFGRGVWHVTHVFPLLLGWVQAS